MRAARTALIAAVTATLATATAVPAGAAPRVGRADQPMVYAGAPGVRSMPRRSRVAPVHRAGVTRALAARGLGTVIWDDDTGVPAQLTGAGAAVPGAMADAAVAERAARELLAAHLAVLAPGASLADLELASNVVDGGLRTVAFRQRWRGLPVDGAQVSVWFKADRLFVVSSQLLPDISVATGRRGAADASVRGAAERWLQDAVGATVTTSAGDELILPLVRSRGAIGPDVEYRRVRRVAASVDGGHGQWDVFVDSTTAEPVARRNKLHFGTGTVLYNAPERYPGSTRVDYPAPTTRHTVDGVAVTSDAAGLVTWPSTTTATVVPGLTGPLARIINRGAAAAAVSLDLAPGGSVVWNAASNETLDAQLTAFIHVHKAKAYVKGNIAPTLAWLDDQIDVYVNENDTCNAYSTGDDIHFFRSGDCENTGRLADVVHHEFGHSLHAHAIIDGVGAFDGSLSEGVSDYLAATISNDPGMGRGFFYDNRALRHLDPTRDKRWPEDVDPQDVHGTGEIIGGTLWDLRKALVAELGDPAGVRVADAIFYGILQRASDIPSSYLAALATDDDDGNLDNGTPHECAIRAAFDAHGLAGITNLVAPTRDGLSVSFGERLTAASSCPVAAISGANLVWQVRGDASQTGTIALTRTATADGASWSGQLPAMAAGTVLNYRIDATMSNGSTFSYPDNPADPMYEVYLGNVQTLWCADFETEPTDWTHMAVRGSDDWQWAPARFGSPGDPLVAHGGTSVFGTDVIGDGLYSSRSNQVAISPEIDVTGHTQVRLQYHRWLGVEDATYDSAAILVDGERLWSNQESDGSLNHTDKEWRFHDLDLSAQAADGKVQLTFGLTSDDAFELGGWALDDVCIVTVAAAACGDGALDGGEACDDGNTADGDGCSATCADETTGGGEEPGDEAGCCSSQRDPGGAALLAMVTLGLVVRRRRRVIVRG